MTQTILHKLVNDSHRLAKSSKPNYLAAIDRWIKFAGVDPAKWTRYRMQEFYDSLLKEGLKPQSAARVVISVRYAAQRWAEMEAKPELDFSVIEFAKNKATKHRPALTKERVIELLDTCERTPYGLRDLTFFVVALETGMRVMSAAGMTIAETKLEPVALEGSAVKLPRTWVPLKGRDGLHPVPLSAVTVDVLRAWLSWLASHKVKTGPVFRAMRYSVIDRIWSIAASPLSKRAFYDIAKDRAEAAEIGHLHPHLFRHTFVTWRKLAGVPDEQISAITLHKLEETKKMGTIWDYIDKGGEISTAAIKHTPSWLANYVERWLTTWKGRPT